MKSFQRIGYSLLIATATLAGGLASGGAAAQDIRQDIEVFFTSTGTSTAKPNVLFILDTSQSMFTPESSTTLTFDKNDPNWDSGPCDGTKYYWATDTDTPSCATAVPMDPANFHCTAWATALEAANAAGFETRGPIKVAQQDPVGGTTFKQLAQADLPTWCEGDGDVPMPAGLDWGATGKRRINSVTYTFYRGDYLNFLAGSSGGDKYRIDIVREVVAKVLANTRGIKAGLMRYGYDGDRVFSENDADHCVVEPNPIEDSRSSNGAPVVFPVTDLDATTAVTGFPESKDVKAGESIVLSQLRYQLGVDANDEVISWDVNPAQAAAAQPFQVAFGGGGSCPIPLFTPGGRSPIGAAMAEAYLYYAGKQWSQKYGKNADLGSTFRYPSVPQSRIDGFDGGEIYDSPIEDECAKNYIVLLSDGTTEQDNDIDPTIQGLPGFRTSIGSNKCDNDPYLDVNGTPPPSQCVDDIAEYMLETDLSAVSGLNNVITHTVGFKLGQDAAANSARQLLEETAQRGGGNFIEAHNALALEFQLTDILRQILTENTTFSAPAVTVNAFNRTQNLNDLYMSLFRPDFSYRWIGNLKKYELDPVDGDIIDADGAAAIDPATGFFFETARSHWSGISDGNDIAEGGAASRFVPANRNIYTNADDSTVDTTNVDLTAYPVSAITDDAIFGIQAGDTVSATDSNPLTAAEVKDWIAGIDVSDLDGDTNSTEARLDMGDPLHARPATVIYGGTAADPDLDDAAVFAITNDGFLHSFDPTDGSELWAYIPADQLGRMRNLYYDDDIVNPRDRGYGLDGNVRVLRIDHNRNGIVESDPDGPDDQVILFFGQRRGGSNYYAVDVTSKNSPRLLWARNYGSYGAGQSWSSPQPMRVRIGSSSTSTLALAIGGGYDPQEDDIPWVTPGPVAGNRVLIVDALDGDVLWWAGNTSSADLNLAKMDRSIPGDIRAIDLTGDGLADRMYAADLGGRVWRFDVLNGNDPSELVKGGVFASLGVGDSVSKPDADNRRFFYAPDVSLISTGGQQFLNVAIGSGHRELPATDLTTQNWFYSMRDYNVFSVIDNDEYRDDTDECPTPLTEPCHDIIEHDDARAALALTDVSTTLAPVTGRGWKLALASSGPDIGEKALAESRTFQSSTFFTTYAPREEADPDLVCAPRFGINKLYVVNTATGAPVYDLDTSTTGATSISDRSKELSQGSIAPEVVFVFPTPDEVTPGVTPPAAPPICLVGLENCGTGITNPPVRTYWRQRGAD